MFVLVLWIALSSILAILLDEGLGYKVNLNIIWFDLWIGIYYDRKNRIIYINPLPCVVWKCEKRVVE
jgi:hypothetical protein